MNASDLFPISVSLSVLEDMNMIHRCVRSKNVVAVKRDNVYVGCNIHYNAILCVDNIA